MMTSGRGARYSAFSMPMPVPSHQSTGVPQVDAGYYWEAANTVGFGTTGFRVLEGNGHSNFDFVQATVASQPTLLTENGGAQFRMRRSDDANQSSLTTSGAVAAGWTGATYIAMWARLPDGVGVITANGFGGGLFAHTAVSNQRINLFPADGTPDTVSLQLFPVAAGTGNGIKRFDNANIFAGAGWVWLEGIFDPLLALGGSTDADKFKMFTGLTSRAIALSAGAAITGTTIANSTAQIKLACIAAGFANGDTTDWAACYYGNGIPSLANRCNPTGILLVA